MAKPHFLEIPADAGVDASPWVRRWSHLVRPGASVLDVACGAGRHVRWFTQRGCRVTGVDRDAAALAALAGVAHTVMADIEAGPWPFAGQRFDAVVVTRYLWRPLFPALIDCLADGGVLLYETFATGQQTLGRPSNPEFLLRPGELLRVAGNLRVVAFEDGFLAGPERFMQRLAAVRHSAPCDEPSRPPPRFPLEPPTPGAERVKSVDSEDPA